MTLHLDQFALVLIFDWILSERASRSSSVPRASERRDRLRDPCFAHTRATHQRAAMKIQLEARRARFRVTQKVDLIHVLLRHFSLLHYLMNVGAIRRWRTAGSSLERAAVNNPALRAVAKNVHDIDLKENKFGRTEVAGVRGALGLSAAAAVSMFRFKVGMIPTLAACCISGIVLYLMGSTL